MTSVVRSVLGLSILLSMTVGCSDGGSGDSGPLTLTGGTGSATGGASGTGGAVGTGGTVGAGGTGTATGTPLPILDGWVDASATVGIQGAIFPYADDTTTPSVAQLAADYKYVGAKACLTGEAAQVDLQCGAADCYGEVWGAAIGLNLNQPIDPVSMMGMDPPLTFDASNLQGFGFTIDGPNVPVPAALRFKVEVGVGDGVVEYCTPADVPVVAGDNKILFSQLIDKCWDKTLGGTNPPVTGLGKIAWAVVTNDQNTVPFDFCVSNIVAIPK